MPISALILAENRRIVARDYRNRRVGDFLKELHLTEGRGTGIPTTKRAMEPNQSPPPVFETDDPCTYFLTVLPVNPEAKATMSDQVSDQVGDQVSALLAYASGPQSREDLLAHIGLKNHFDNYKKHLEPLLDRGWIAMTVPDKPRSRNQRYQLTPAGQGVLKKRR